MQSAFGKRCKRCKRLHVNAYHRNTFTCKRLQRLLKVLSIGMRPILLLSQFLSVTSRQGSLYTYAMWSGYSLNHVSSIRQSSSLVLSCLRSHYALPAFAGHLTADDRNRINAISRKALRRGVTLTAFDIAEIINKFDRKLFSQIIHPGHCLYHLLPPKTPGRCR